MAGSNPTYSMGNYNDPSGPVGANAMAGAQPNLLMQMLQGQQDKENAGVGLTGQLIGAQSAQNVAKTQAEASKFGATKGAEASEYGATKGAEASEYGAAQGAGASEYGAAQSRAAQQYGADAQRIAAEYGANQQLAGVQATQAGESSRQSQLLDTQRGYFNQIFPLAQQGLGYLTGGGAAGGPGGYNTAGQPTISQAPIYTPGQVQAQQNAYYAQSAQQVANQQRAEQNRLAGQGYGANSPLYQMLSQGYQMGGNQQAANLSQQFGQQAAQQNAQQRLQSQTAAEAQYASRQQEQIARQQTAANTSVGLLGAISQLIGGLG